MRFACPEPRPGSILSRDSPPLLPPAAPLLKKLIHEVHRRSLWQVLGIYLVGSWVALQVVDVLGNMVALPAWFPGFALALLVIGLPVVLATAFVQERGAGREDLEELAPASPDTPIHPGVFTWKNATLGGVAALALLGVATVGWWVFGGGPVPEPGVPQANAAGATAADLHSVAVLPFATRSSVEDDVYFADGMHDDLLTQLSKIADLTVISRTSVEKYRDTEMSIPDIARELGVATIMEGGIQRSGNRVRVNVQLIEAATDRHLWAETYDEELTAESVFRIQSDLAQKIAGALQATLTPEQVERITALPTKNLDAFDLYTRGRYLYERSAGNRPVITKALDLFQQAAALDSTYALAWAGIADAWEYGGSFAFDPEEGHANAWVALNRALELDPNLAEALARRGLMNLTDGKEAQAEEDFRKALELNPGSALVNSRYGGFLSRTGRTEEAVENARRAVQLNPVQVGTRLDLENLLWTVGEFEEGLRVSQGTVALDASATQSWYNVGWFAGMLGQIDTAIQAFEKCIDLSEENDTYRSALAWAFAKAGRRDEAVRELSTLRGAEGGWDVANTWYLLGDKDRAFASLEVVFKADPTMATDIRTDWSSADLIADPRFGQLLKKLDLE